MKNSEWSRSNADIFWGEIAPTDHVVQIYENESVFLDALAGFVGGGIKAGDCVIVIATAGHLKELNDRLLSYSIRTDTLRNDDRYIPLDAHETLDKFMVNGRPDEKLFNQTISTVLHRAQCKERRVRAFGEMVAILWADGNKESTVELEELWNRFCGQNKLCLFCAYPKTGFTDDANQSIKNICNCHTMMIEGSEKQLTEVLYSNVKKAI